jgi:hypothetical protein
VLALLAFVTTSCGSYTPPAAPAPVAYSVHAPFDAVWTEVVAYFADTKVPIQTIDKSSGLIATRAFQFNKVDSIQWLDCGQASMGAMGFVHSDQLLGDFNVFVRNFGDSVTVRVNLTATAHNAVETLGSTAGQTTDIPYPCVSNGRFEKELVERLKTAEGESQV